MLKTARGTPRPARTIASDDERLYIYTGRAYQRHAPFRQRQAEVGVFGQDAEAKVGWLHYEEADYAGIGSRIRARLLDEHGVDLLEWLDHARLVACRGTKGALIEGVQYRRKGAKHSVGDRQAWWAEAPPRTAPLLDHQAYILARERLWRRQIEAGWGPD